MRLHQHFNLRATGDNGAGMGCRVLTKAISEIAIVSELRGTTTWKYLAQHNMSSVRECKQLNQANKWMRPRLLCRCTNGSYPENNQKFNDLFILSRSDYESALMGSSQSDSDFKLHWLNVSMGSPLRSRSRRALQNSSKVSHYRWTRGTALTVFSNTCCNEHNTSRLHFFSID